MTTEDRGNDQAAVAALLAAAGLSPPEQELQRLAELHPWLLASVDRFHQVDTGDEVQAAVFRAQER